MPDLDSLVEVFRQYPGIQAVYLFGSRAGGRTRSGSDLDLAVVPAEGAPEEQRLSILADLTRAGFDNVDLVFLDGDDLVLAFEAVRRNRLIYQSEGFDRGAYYSRVVRVYLDFLPYLKVQRAAYKRRILDGQA
jgi:predicted nucleotidyltransferase